ncbi:energy transducer TonB [Agaribacterium haliotis]|uniref:energy transducer TonB n=1 Tax=Agaribacterium haliotis TaxID=2013869 RepID=UPI000BB53ADC|nr:energy transducer TonB [Agaribacterium haliotis]
MNSVDYGQLFGSGLLLAMGAGLSFFSLWAAQWWRARQDPAHQASGLRRRINLLEQISSDVGAVNHSFAKYSALVIESTRFGKRWPPARKQELERINSELVQEFHKLAEAEAKLLMLGEKTMEKTLRLYGAKIALFRKQVYIGRQDISEQEIAELKTSILTLREQFYDLLSRRYDKLLTA